MFGEFVGASLEEEWSCIDTKFTKYENRERCFCHFRASRFPLTL